MTRLVAARDDYDYYEGHLDSAADHTAYLTGELVDDFVIAGPAEQVPREAARAGRARRRRDLVRLPERRSSSRWSASGREIVPALAGRSLA